MPSFWCSLLEQNGASHTRVDTVPGGALSAFGARTLSAPLSNHELLQCITPPGERRLSPLPVRLTHGWIR